MNTIDLSGKVAVVTGAGTGIGAGVAAVLAACGADLFLHHIAPLDLNRYMAGWEKKPVRVATGVADFAADPWLAARMVDQAVESLGRVDVLVNAAGITRAQGHFESIGRKVYDDIMAVNVTAAFAATQQAGKHMMERGSGGRIISISSINSRMVFPGNSVYEMSKAAINALTFSAAIALGKHGITVNAVAPGITLVERNSEFYAKPENRSWFLSRLPLGRFGHREDIAWMIAYLASDHAGYVTGETITVDGGVSKVLAYVPAGS